MLFLFMLWAGYYDQGDYTQGYRDTTYDDEKYISSKKNKSSYGPSYSKSEKRYAKGDMPENLQDEILEIFSDETVREIWELPDTIEALRQWNVSRLSFPGHDISERRERAINRAIEDLSSIIKRKDSYFYENNRSLIKQVVEGMLYEKETAAIKQLLLFIQSMTEEEKKRLNALQREAKEIKEREPKIKRQMHVDYSRISQEEQRLDEKMEALEKKLKQPYSDENKKGYDQQTLTYLQEDKQLLLDDSKHVQHDLDRQMQRFKKIKELEFVLRADLEKIEDMPKEVSIVLKRRKDDADLKKAWDKINHHFAKLEENKKKDKSREEEEAHKLAEKRAQEAATEEKDQTQEMQMLQGLEKEVSPPEAVAEAKKSEGLLGGFFKMISSGG